MKNYRLQIENRKRETKEALIYALNSMGVGPAGFELLDINGAKVSEDEYINKYVYFRYFLHNGKVHVEAYVKLRSYATGSIGGFRMSTKNLSWRIF